MGSAQSKKRPRMPTFSNYTRLPSSSPLKEKLLMEDCNQGWNISQEYEAITKDIFNKYTTNEKKVLELERKNQGLVSKNSVVLAKVVDLEQKVESLTLLLEGKVKENAAAGKKIVDLEEKYERIEQLFLSKNTETERSIMHLQAKTDCMALMSLQNGMEEAVKLQAKTDGVVLMSLQNGMEEAVKLQAKTDGLSLILRLQNAIEETIPEYVYQMNQVTLMLVLTVVLFLCLLV